MFKWQVPNCMGRAQCVYSYMQGSPLGHSNECISRAPLLCPFHRTSEKGSYIWTRNRPEVANLWPSTFHPAEWMKHSLNPLSQVQPPVGLREAWNWWGNLPAFLPIFLSLTTFAASEWPAQSHWQEQSPQPLARGTFRHHFKQSVRAGARFKGDLEKLLGHPIY